MGKLKEIKGVRFERLVAMERTRNEHGDVAWICQCDCGNTVIVRTADLMSGNTKSCGCYKIDGIKNRRTKHKMSRSPLYGVWNTMKSRCCNPKSEKYKNYGGRGITICDEWLHDFQAFYDWAIANGYREDLTIDRKDVNGNYCPENCRWATQKEQASNKTNNRMITLEGETRTLQEWCKITGISPSTVIGRTKRGWPIERALTEKLHK